MELTGFVAKIMEYRLIPEVGFYRQMLNDSALGNYTEISTNVVWMQVFSVIPYLVLTEE